jgi:hypothetical protein
MWLRIQDSNWITLPDSMDNRNSASKSINCEPYSRRLCVPRGSHSNRSDEMVPRRCGGVVRPVAGRGRREKSREKGVPHFGSRDEEKFKTEEAGELNQTFQCRRDGPGVPSISLAQGLNEQCVELVCDLAASSSIEKLPRFILQNRDLRRLAWGSRTQARRGIPFCCHRPHRPRAP